MLLFKEGFTVQPLPDGQSPQYYGIDENLIWRNGISIPAAVNHNVYIYDKKRIDLLFGDHDLLFVRDFHFLEHHGVIDVYFVWP